MLPDIVIPYRNQGRKDNLELRYALRSLSFIPHNNVVFYGEAPEWVTNVQVVLTPSTGKWEDLDNVWRLFAENHDLTEEVVYTEDDYFMLYERSLENFYFNTLAERYNKLRGRGANGAWTQSILATKNVLQRNGIPHPISFDMHIPMIVRRSEVPLDMRSDSPVRWRSMYGNVASREPVFLTPDVKCVTVEELQNVLDSDNGFLSSNEQTFTSSGVQSVLETVHPEPCKYEK